MPIYDYQCQQCGKILEFMVAIDSRDKVRFQCDDCQGKMARIPTTANFGKSPHRTKAILAGGKKIDGTWEK